MHPARARLIHNRPQQAGPVVYWMHRELRAQDNWPLLHAADLARERGQPLCVAVCLAQGYGLARPEHFAFLAHGLRETAHSLSGLSIPLVVLRGEPGREVPDFVRLVRAGLVVTAKHGNTPRLGKATA